MSWIKRNLYFVIGSVVALALMGLAGWYLYSNWQANSDILSQLDAQFAELQRLNSENPGPGDDKVNNIATAKAQEKQLRSYIEESRKLFQRIPSIPDSPKPSMQEFSSALRRTIEQLQHSATNASVALPADYSFSFAAERQLLRFSPASLESLAGHLGEVKTICDTLFQAKINALDNLRRERVSTDDTNMVDYVEQSSVTNGQAVLTPYEITFRCFTPELASVLSLFASSPNAIVVKYLSVVAAPAVASEPVAASAQQTFVQPVQPPPMPQNPQAAEDAYLARYGLKGRRGPAQPAPMPAPMVAAPGPAAPKGPQTIISERQLQVTMMLNVVKLLPSK